MNSSPSMQDILKTFSHRIDGFTPVLGTEKVSKTAQKITYDTTLEFKIRIVVSYNDIVFMVELNDEVLTKTWSIDNKDTNLSNISLLVAKSFVPFCLSILNYQKSKCTLHLSTMVIQNGFIHNQLHVNYREMFKTDCTYNLLGCFFDTRYTEDGICMEPRRDVFTVGREECTRAPLVRNQYMKPSITFFINGKTIIMVLCTKYMDYKRAWDRLVRFSIL